jgi:hypothetical protein
VLCRKGYFNYILSFLGVLGVFFQDFAGNGRILPRACAQFAWQKNPPALQDSPGPAAWPALGAWYTTSASVTCINDERAETLAHLVDERLHEAIREKLTRAAKVQAEGVDWRQIYSGRNGNERTVLGAAMATIDTAFINGTSNGPMLSALSFGMALSLSRK